MAYILEFPTFTSFDYALSTIDRDNAIETSNVFIWLTYGKISESPVVTPTYHTTNVGPSSRRRYIDDVIVNAIPNTIGTAAIGTTGSIILNNTQFDSATTSNAAYATATVANGVLTISGVAAGTATINVYDRNKDLIYTLTVTVS